MQVAHHDDNGVRVEDFMRMMMAMMTIFVHHEDDDVRVDDFCHILRYLLDCFCHI